MSDNPHQSVFARLGASDRHGVGVFAITAIPAGTNIFANDHLEISWIDDAVLSCGLTEEQRKLYEDFAIRKDGKLGCPVNFNVLTVGWYLNQPRESEEPNVRIGPDFSMIACRDIFPGQELTIVYQSYSSGTLFN